MLVTKPSIKMIVTGEGIGYKASPDDTLDRVFIEWRFVLQVEDNVSHYIELLGEAPLKTLSLVKGVIDVVQIVLRHWLLQRLVFSLANPVAFTISTDD